MVLWEITLGTAYFLGLRRTYRLALKIQRRIISPKHPRVRQFVQRRTRTIFDVALRVHKNIQERDLEMGRSFGNWILRWLDKMKPAAQIRPPPVRPHHPGANSKTTTTKQLTDSSHAKNSSTTQMPRNNDSSRHLFTSSTILWPKSLTAAAKMMRPSRPSGFMTQYRQFYTSGVNVSTRGGSEGFIRKDIMQWMVRN